MHLMDFRVTKLFPQCSLKQIPKSHTILKDQGNKIPSNRDRQEKETADSGSLSCLRKETPYCQVSSSIESREDGISTPTSPTLGFQPKALHFKQVFPQELPALECSKQLCSFNLNVSHQSKFPMLYKTKTLRCNTSQFNVK